MSSQCYVFEYVKEMDGGHLRFIIRLAYTDEYNDVDSRMNVNESPAEAYARFLTNGDLDIYNVCGWMPAWEDKNIEESYRKEKEYMKSLPSDKKIILEALEHYDWAPPWEFDT